MNPPFLYLQTFFFTGAHCLHKQHPCLYSQELLDLRQRLFNTNILKISIQVCDGDHYTSYVTSANAVKFNHGDLMCNPPLTDALQVFQWAFSDIPGFSQDRIDSEQVAHQGHGNGSCGLGAFNFVEQHIDLSIPLWSGQHSQTWYCTLHDLVLYHMTAKEASGCVLSWVLRFVPITKHDILVNNTDGFCGYNDYNLYSPKVHDSCSYCGHCWLTYENVLPPEWPSHLPIPRQAEEVDTSPTFKQLNPTSASPHLHSGGTTSWCWPLSSTQLFNGS